jgi:hypothetical protein
MIAARLEELRAAHGRLLAANAVWVQEFRKAKLARDHHDLVSVTRRLDDAFLDFIEASRCLRKEAPGLQRHGRESRRRPDLGTTQASFVALSSSLGILNRAASARAYLGRKARHAAAGVYRRISLDSD